VHWQGRERRERREREGGEGRTVWIKRQEILCKSA
jgi:hypothetical protein